jgi:SLOG cluster3 family
MPLIVDDLAPSPVLENLPVFVSASIPDPDRWDGSFDALEITDAVVSLARVFLSAGAQLVTAAHPTIAPLLMYVAAELPAARQGKIVIYQSRLFADVLPPATQRFQEAEIGQFKWTPAAPGETPEPGNWTKSLRNMREKMFDRHAPAAAIFVGGMSGIAEEWKLFHESFPDRPRYPLGRPGGEARKLRATGVAAPLAHQLSEGEIYPAIWRAVLDDLRARLS